MVETKLSTSRTLEHIEKRISTILPLIQSMAEAIEEQEEQISSLEDKVNLQASRIIHLTNNAVQERNIGRINSIMITRLDIPSVTSDDDIKKIIEDLLQFLDVKDYELTNQALIPWGTTSTAIKSTFKKAATCGAMLRTSWKPKGPHTDPAFNKYTKCFLRPNLSVEQRQVRKK